MGAVGAWGIVVVAELVAIPPGVEAVQGREVAYLEHDEDERGRDGTEPEVAGPDDHTDARGREDRRRSGDTANERVAVLHHHARADEADAGDDTGQSLWRCLRDGGGHCG